MVTANDNFHPTYVGFVENGEDGWRLRWQLLLNGKEYNIVYDDGYFTRWSLRLRTQEFFRFDYHTKMDEFWRYLDYREEFKDPKVADLRAFFRKQQRKLRVAAIVGNL